jgi:hypothetical protein
MDTVRTRPSSRPAGAGSWLVVILLSVIATCLLIEVGRGVDAARGEPSVASSGGGDVIVVSAQLAADAYGVYLLDTKRGTMAVYQFQPSKRTLRLMAVRGYGFDMQLDEYNTEPSPLEIKKLVQQQQRLGDTK